MIPVSQCVINYYATQKFLRGHFPLKMVLPPELGLNDKAIESSLSPVPYILKVSHLFPWIYLQKNPCHLSLIMLTSDIKTLCK